MKTAKQSFAHRSSSISICRHCLKNIFHRTDPKSTELLREVNQFKGSLSLTVIDISESIKQLYFIRLAYDVRDYTLGATADHGCISSYEVRRSMVSKTLSVPRKVVSEMFLSQYHREWCIYDRADGSLARRQKESRIRGLSQNAGFVLYVFVWVSKYEEVPNLLQRRLYLFLIKTE